jgi:hypothetical protein
LAKKLVHQLHLKYSKLSSYRYYSAATALHYYQIPALKPLMERNSVRHICITYSWRNLRVAKFPLDAAARWHLEGLINNAELIPPSNQIKPGSRLLFLESIGVRKSEKRRRCQKLPPARICIIFWRGGGVKIPRAGIKQ